MEFPGYALAGVGEYLGHYLIRSRYTGNAMSLSEVVALAVTSLSSVKSHDGTCGGASELVVLGKDGGISSIESLDISHGENLTNRFWTAANRLLSIIAQPDVAQTKVDAALEDFASDVEAALKYSRSTRHLQHTIEKLGNDKALRVRRDVYTKQRRKRLSDTN
jgi:hypothetical protein